MKITILTLFPKMVSTFFEESIIKRAIDKSLVEVELINLRDFAKDNYKSVDDKPYGGGAGMILRVDVLHRALNNFQLPISNYQKKTILTSAKGQVFNQKKAQEYAKLDHLIVIAGHYEGVDERALEYIDEEISMGDFVMTGGEIAAAGIADAVARLIPGVLKKEEASQLESFFKVSTDELEKIVGSNKTVSTLKNKGITSIQLLEYPQYTRPEEYEGQKVPEVLLSGNHEEIRKWRIKKAFEETLKKRPDLLEARS